MRSRPSRTPVAKQKASTPKLKGRTGKVWLSREFVMWCKRRGYKPEGLAVCIIHGFALDNPASVRVIHYGRPVNVENIYDLPDDRKEGK